MTIEVNFKGEPGCRKPLFKAQSLKTGETTDILCGDKATGWNPDNSEYVFLLCDVCKNSQK